MHHLPPKAKFYVFLKLSLSLSPTPSYLCHPPPLLTTPLFNSQEQLMLGSRTTFAYTRQLRATFLQLLLLRVQKAVKQCRASVSLSLIFTHCRMCEMARQCCQKGAPLRISVVPSTFLPYCISHSSSPTSHMVLISAVSTARSATRQKFSQRQFSLRVLKGKRVCVWAADLA